MLDNVENHLALAPITSQQKWRAGALKPLKWWWPRRRVFTGTPHFCSSNQSISTHEAQLSSICKICCSITLPASFSQTESIAERLQATMSYLHQHRMSPGDTSLLSMSMFAEAAPVKRLPLQLATPLAPSQNWIVILRCSNSLNDLYAVVWPLTFPALYNMNSYLVSVRF